MLFELLAKTNCQIIAEVDDTTTEDVGAMRRSKIWKAQANAFTWTLSIDSSNAPKPPPDAPPSPTRGKRKSEERSIFIKVNFKIGDDLIITIPISGDKANVSIWTSTSKF